MEKIIAYKIMNEKDVELIIPFLISKGGINALGFKTDNIKIDEFLYIHPKENIIQLHMSNDRFIKKACDVVLGVPEDFDPEEHVLMTDEQLIYQIMDFGDGFDSFHTRDVSRLLDENIMMKSFINQFCEKNPTNFEILIQSLPNKNREFISKIAKYKFVGHDSFV